MKKRLFSLFLALAMVLSWMPANFLTAVRAEEYWEPDMGGDGIYDGDYVTLTLYVVDNARWGDVNARYTTMTESDVDIALGYIGTNVHGHSIYEFTLEVPEIYASDLMITFYGGGPEEKPWHSPVDGQYYELKGGSPLDDPDMAPFEEEIYFVNTESWENVYLYVYDDDGNEPEPWPGVQLDWDGSTTFDEDYEVYTYIIDDGNSMYPNIIFNDGSEQESAEQSDELTLVEDTVISSPFFDMASNNWYADLESIPAPDSWVASGTCGTNLTWTLSEDGTLTISGTGDMWDYYDIPNPWDPYVVSELVFVGEITSIGASAFTYSNLSNVTIPEGVTAIGESAFADCENLMSL